MPPGRYERIKRRMIAGWGSYPLIGTPEQIVDQLTALTSTGLDGIVLSWVNYRDEMRQWINEVMTPCTNAPGMNKSPRDIDLVNRPGTSRERFERMLAAAEYLAAHIHEALST